ncbi:WD40 repeat-like protein [Trametes meyenii]|nr:WD40 repeat-like protein [Trametes meyenii]
MRKHFDQWLNFANEDCEMILGQEQIYFVHGVVKTSRWVCAAFQGSRSNKDVSLNAQIPNIGSLKMSMSFNKEDAPQVDYNYGPPTSKISEPNKPECEPTEATRKQDQCIFFNYYKAKKRLWLGPKVMEAAAGPHELPPGDREGESSNDPISTEDASYDSDDFEEVPRARVPHDPVDFLLDYILAHSEAEIAIASDMDLYALFHHVEFPSDIENALEELKPTIDVDEDGTGTVIVDHNLIIDQPPQAEQTAAASASDREGDPGFTHVPGTQDVSQINSAAESRAENRPQTPPARAQPIPPPDNRIAPRSSAQANPTDVDDDTLTKEVVHLSRRTAAAVHDGSVTSLVYSHDSKWIATAAEDATIALRNAEEQTAVRKLVGHEDVVHALAFSPDDKRLASASSDGSVRIWAVETGEQLATLSGHEGAIHALAWSSDGKYIASGSSDTTVRLWDGDTYAQIAVLRGHEAMVVHLTFSRDDRWLASCSMDHFCRIWDVSRRTSHRVLRGHENMLWRADFDPEGRRIATCSEDTSARIWNVETGDLLVVLHEHQGPVYTATFAPDGRSVLTASTDGTMKICNSFTGERILALEGHEDVINAACFSPDGKFIASAACDNTVRLWRADYGELVATFNEHEDKVMQVMFSPDGETLASGSEDGTVHVRQVNEWGRIRQE